MNKFRFSMLFAAALTIVSVALPMSAASLHNSNHGQVFATPPTDDFAPPTQATPPTDDLVPQMPATPPTDD
jgi:hypothetical protein